MRPKTATVEVRDCSLKADSQPVGWPGKAVVPCQNKIILKNFSVLFYHGMSGSPLGLDPPLTE